MKYTRQFHSVKPFESVTWEEKTAELRQGDAVIFKQEKIRVPSTWSQLALNIVASKYFYGAMDTPQRETGVDQLVSRVADTISDWGLEDGYFADAESRDTYCDDLSYLLLNQYAAFNSPVWFNVGLAQKYGVTADPCNWYWDRKTNRIKQPSNPLEYPQVSACFIQHVSDSMDGIMDLARSEAMLFKFGSGSGSNLSTLRASCEALSGGGKPSGPISFMRVYDQVAEVVTSGGRTRRAALLKCLDIGHPDIAQFISCKMEEEAHANMLVARGVAPGRASKSVMYQNMNISARVNDAFMEAVEADGTWATHWVTDPNREGPTFKAQALWKRIAECAWACGDPGLQYDTTINRWNTIPRTGRICASNPCSEFMAPDNTACNLASINLMKFYHPDGGFEEELFLSAVRVLIIAQDILVDRASYPIKEIARNAHRCRQLGLGYTNFGALCMACGFPYDSDQARRLCGCITAMMTAQAYLTSAQLADELGPFEEWDNNAEDMLRVLDQHADAAGQLNDKLAQELWDIVLLKGKLHGFRNSQVTLLAPTGTISFMMDCDTTGIEPDIALIKTKNLVGGGTLRLINCGVKYALQKLGLSDTAIATTLEYLDREETIVGCGTLMAEEERIFATSLGKNPIPWQAHLQMMAAAQPFLSGAISKTVNLPASSTVDDMAGAYFMGWKLGLKSVALYRDGSKTAQPVNIKKEDVLVEAAAIAAKHGKGFRERLPDTRQSITHKFTIGGHEGYFTVGLFPDGRPGELFISVAKEGSTLGGIFDCFGIAVSIALQYGVPLSEFIDKFSHVRFEPMGYTKSPEVRSAKSIVDYIFRWLSKQFVPGASVPVPDEIEEHDTDLTPIGTLDAPICDNCGELCVRVGTCYLCYSCGSSGGCS